MSKRGRDGDEGGMRMIPDGLLTEDLFRRLFRRLLTPKYKPIYVIVCDGCGREERPGLTEVKNGVALCRECKPEAPDDGRF